MAQEASQLHTGETPDESNYPLLKSERNWGRIELFIVLLVAACATWCYVIGEYVGYYLNLKQGFATMTSGSMFGMLIVALAVVPAATKYGIDSIVSARPQFGSNGWIITVALQYISIIGWNSILIIFFGSSLRELLATIGLIGEEGKALVQPIATLGACALIFGVLMTGKSGVARVSNVLFFFIVGVGIWMVWLLLAREGTAISEATPAYASDAQWDYVTGIEIGIVSLLSWWPYIGALVRVSPDAHTATVPSMVGMGLPVPLLSVIGLAAILALETSDPSMWMVQLGGSFYGAIALAFVIAANLGTAIAGVYATAVGLKSVPAISRLPWWVTLLLGIVPVVIVGTFLPDLFFNNFGSFLAFIGVFFSPLCAIQIVDFLILRKRKLDVRGLYDGSEDAPYYYWFGLNPAAIAGMVAGFVTYIYLLNPLTYVSRSPYEYLTASLPTAVIGGLVYYLVTIALVKPAGKGGYN
ncbi:cytosine permease [Methyloligella sp. 2.7D]|uniref:purine-cytosine permease family protein n=1 Tax=unclassified Methyloligella TaxID=2625955 RepID=UPI00157E27DB|nr:cytosine permease [Methyloligella sp. GL2]QKP76891.1 cytosine permease [Methyloligella sp. GL2]